MSSTDWEFIFDGIFGFLSSPLWLAPISAFIEENSIVFQETDENHLAWTEVHKKYSDLIESLISSYLKDVGITDEQFLEACKMPSVQHQSAMQTMFEQLWAADDFEIFKRMMIQKNLELQLQALEIIRKRQGKKSSKKKKVGKPNKTEEEILAEVIKQSEKEYQEMQNRKDKEGEAAVANSNYDEKMEKLISESSEQVDRLEQEVLQKQEETKQLVEENISVEETKDIIQEKNAQNNDSGNEEEKTSSETNSSNNPNANQPVPKKEPLKPLKATNSTNTDIVSDWIKQAKAENESTSSTRNANVSRREDDMDKREAYLIQQRDRLLELKRKEREKQLNQYTKTQPKARPSSARIAKQALGGETPQASVPEPSADELKRIAMRKALAEKLKKEVVHK